MLEKVAATANAADASDDAQQLASGRPGAADARSLPGGERRVSRRGCRGAARSGHQTRLGRDVPRDVQQSRSAEVVPGGAEGRSDVGAGAARHGAARCADDDPPQAVDAGEEGARNQSLVRRRAAVHRGSRRPTPGIATRRAQAIQKALDGQPVEPRRARAARRARATSRTSSRSSSRDRQGAGDRAELRRGVPRSPASWPRTITASTKPSMLARRGLALDPNEPAQPRPTSASHLLRTGDEAGARARRSKQSFKIDPYDVVTYNLLQMMDTLDKFVTVRDGDFDHPHAQGRGAGHAGLRRAAGAPGARHACRSATSSRRRARS